MTTLEPGFEDKARKAFADEAADQLFAERDNLAFRFAQTANDNFRVYASQHDYDINHIWEDFTVTDARRTRNGAEATIEWPPLTALFEHGVSPHTITGNPLLHFYWEAIDQWIQTEEVNWGSETGGIPESRAIRRAIQSFRASLRRRGTGGQFI